MRLLESPNLGESAHFGEMNLGESAHFSKINLGESAHFNKINLGIPNLYSNFVAVNIS